MYTEYTYPSLMLKMHQHYDYQELKQFSLAYTLAQKIFHDKFRASGKSLLSHLVGTAALLAEIQSPIDLVISGLLHAAYFLGNFGELENYSIKLKREVVRNYTNIKTESYIWIYTSLKSQKTNILDFNSDILKDPNAYSIFLLAVANNIEDCLDVFLSQKSQNYNFSLLQQAVDKLAIPAFRQQLDKNLAAFQKISSSSCDRDKLNVIIGARHRSSTVSLLEDSLAKQFNSYKHDVSTSNQDVSQDATVDIVVVPRERFSLSLRSLDSIYQNTSYPFELIYVDGNSPSHIQEALKNKSVEYKFKLIRCNEYLSPNQARNEGLKQTQAKYVVFIDNDVIVSPKWLEQLVQCAEDTQAGIVGPLYLIGEPHLEAIHMAGGAAGVYEINGQPFMYEEHCLSGQRLSKVQHTLNRRACNHVEFHCMLVRREIFTSIGTLDEGLLSTREHIDLCWLAWKAGYEVYLEPNSIISYVPPPPIETTDLEYFKLRWSDDWNRKSIHRFCQKWKLSLEDPRHQRHYQWLNMHRQRVAQHSSKKAKQTTKTVSVNASTPSLESNVILF